MHQRGGCWAGGIPVGTALASDDAGSWGGELEEGGCGASQPLLPGSAQGCCASVMCLQQIWWFSPALPGGREVSF